MNIPSVVKVTDARFAIMRQLATSFPLVNPGTQAEAEHKLRSEEGRMKSKNGASIGIMRRGGRYNISKSFTRGDTSPLWTLYWLACEIENAQAEFAEADTLA